MPRIVSSLELTNASSLKLDDPNERDSVCDGRSKKREGWALHTIIASELLGLCSSVAASLHRRDKQNVLAANSDYPADKLFDSIDR
jgi:hypothetical protein